MRNEKVTIGKIVSPHGVKGLFKVLVYSENEDSFFSNKSYFKVKNKNLPYPTFDDVDSSKDTKIEINNPAEVPPENFNKQEAMPKDLAQPEIKKKESDVELKEKNETSS